MAEAPSAAWHLFTMLRRPSSSPHGIPAGLPGQSRGLPDHARRQSEKHPLPPDQNRFCRPDPLPRFIISGIRTTKKARTKSGPFLLCHYYANHYANLCQYAVNLDNIKITPDNTFKGYEPRINTEKNSPCRYMTGAVENVAGLAGFKHKSLILCGFSGFYANYYATRQESHEINRLHLLFFRGIHGMCIKP